MQMSSIGNWANDSSSSVLLNFFIDIGLVEKKSKMRED